MRLAVLGCDEATLRLLRWAIDQGGGKIVAAYAVKPHAAELLSLAPGVRLSDDWEELFSLDSIDAVLVAASNPREPASSPHSVSQRGEQLRRIAQAEMPLLVVTPACEAIVGFEIEMISRDTGAAIVPFSTGSLHPATERLAAVVAMGNAGPVGATEQIAVERELRDRSRESVQRQLVHDIGVIRRLIGQVQTVTATGPARAIGRDPLGPKIKELPSLSNLIVVLGGSQNLSARWSVFPSTSSEQARLVVSGQRGKTVLTMPAEGDWSLDIAGDELTSESFSSDAELEGVFCELNAALNADTSSSDSLWLAACRDQEAAEAVDRSLLRGRTIELFHEEHSEASSFKGIMAMGGCLLLSLALCALLLMSVIDGLQLPLRNLQAFRAWPLYLLVPIAAFLLLQLLGFAAKRPLASQATETTHDGQQN